MTPEEWVKSYEFQETIALIDLMVRNTNPAMRPYAASYVMVRVKDPDDSTFCGTDGLAVHQETRDLIALMVSRLQKLLDPEYLPEERIVGFYLEDKIVSITAHGVSREHIAYKPTISVKW